MRGRIAAVVGLILSGLMSVWRDLAATVMRTRGMRRRVIVSGVGVSADELGQDKRKRSHG